MEAKHSHIVTIDLADLIFITAHVRSLRVGTVFTGVCLSTLAGGTPSGLWGVPHPKSRWGVPHPRSGWGGMPSQVQVGRVPKVSPIQTWDGYPPPGPGTAYSLPPIQTWDGVPSNWTWDGVPPHLDLGGILLRSRRRIFLLLLWTICSKISYTKILFKSKRLSCLMCCNRFRQWVIKMQFV